MQVAILGVLVIIALVLAPWLIGVAVALVAAYGVFIVIAGGLALLAGLIAVVWVVMADRKPTEAPPITGARTSCTHCQAEIPASLIYCDNCRQKQ